MLTPVLIHLLTALVGYQPSSPATSDAPPAPAAPQPDRAPPAVAAPEDPGDWLVHLARHQGHLVGRTDPRSAALHVLALVEAAAAASPGCAEAHFWMYDLLGRLGRQEAAVSALATYVKLRPEDDAARLKALELQIDALQTAEARAAFVRDRLRDGGLSRICESELRRRLARHHFERRESRDAEREIEDALRLNPFSRPARELAYEIFGETEPGLQRVELALQLIAANPTQSNLIWELADFLDQISLHRQAQEWYNRAIDIHKAAAASPVPAAHWHRLAVSYMHSGDFERARAAADAALAIDPALHATRLLRSSALSRLNQEQAAAADMQVVADAYAVALPEAIKDPAAPRAAEIAWFYAFHRPDRDRALQLAEAAMRAPQPGSLARLAYGYALHLNGRLDEAIAVLEPLSVVDQMAALELARAYIEREDKSRAMTVLHRATTIQYSGIAYNMIRDLLARYDEAAPEPPAHPRIVAALDKLDRRVFDFMRRPDAFLRFTCRLEPAALVPAGPIYVAFRVENIGPFTLTFGDGYLCRPHVALTATIGDEKPIEFPSYLQVLLNSKVLLHPGDAVERTVAIDVGPLREQLMRTIHADQVIRLSAWFDPVYEDGRLVAGPGTVAAPPVTVVRPAADFSSRALGELMDRALAGDIPARERAADLLGAIIATAVAANETGTKIPPVDLDALRATLARLLSDANWRVRAHALVAAGTAPLDPRLAAAAEVNIRHAHPIVRTLAVRLFADQQGDAFRPVAEALSRGDPDRMVRVMARSFIRTPGTTARAEPSSGD